MTAPLEVEVVLERVVVAAPGDADALAASLARELERLLAAGAGPRDLDVARMALTGLRAGGSAEEAGIRLARALFEEAFA